MIPVPRARPVLRHASVAVLVPEGDTMARAGDPVSVIRGWVQGLGFDGLSYFGVARGASCAFSRWSTWGDRWDIEHRECRYADVDPRLVATLDQSLPCLWEAGTIVARGRLARFLRAAAAYGIRSGVAIPIGTTRQRAVVAFDSSLDAVPPARRTAIVERLGDLLWVAHAVHASRHAAGTTAGAGDDVRQRLTAREQACLTMSARGLTSRDIADKLGIASRTVDFHVGNAIAKLAALNRQEAIAKAVARGWLVM